MMAEPSHNTREVSSAVGVGSVHDARRTQQTVPAHIRDVMII